MVCSAQASSLNLLQRLTEDLQHALLVGVVLDDRTFLEAYHKWMPLQHKLENPEFLGVQNFSPGTFGDCPACAKVPAFDDKGIIATRQAGLNALAQADGFLCASQSQVPISLLGSVSTWHCRGLQGEVQCSLK